MKFFVRGVCVLALLFAFAWNVFAQSNQPDQGAKSDVKEAGSSTKRAIKKTGRKVKKGTRKATHKTAKKTRQGAQKIEDKTEPQ